MGAIAQSGGSSRAVLALSSPPRKKPAEEYRSTAAGPSSNITAQQRGGYSQPIKKERAHASAFMARSSGIQRGHARMQARRTAPVTAAAPRTNNDLEAHSTTDRPRVLLPTEGEDDDREPGQARDERLRVLHRLEPGPGDVGDPPANDPNWQRYEPISKTKLRRRVISHEKLHGFVEDRFLLSSSVLYSLCPPPPPRRRGETRKPDPSMRDGDYDIPIEGDWLIMGVLAEKGPLMECTKFGDSRVHSQDVAEQGKSESTWKGKKEEDKGKRSEDDHDEDIAASDEGREEEEAAMSEMVRYMTVKLVNFSGDSDSSSGDSTMLMTVFEADKHWRDAEGKQHFSGGSGGAFEMLQREQTGALLCLLNPKVRIARGDQRHFMDGVNHDEGYQMLCLKPMAASSVVVVGYAADYGECDALRKNGTRCGSFLDRRKGARACVFHTSLQLERTKGGRQEFANSASTTFQQQKWRETSATSGFGLADGLGGGSWHSKKFVSYGRGPPLSSNDPGSSAFDVASSYGRDLQRREADARKQEQQLDRLFSSSLGKTRTNLPHKRPRLDLSDVKLEEMDRASSVGGKALLDAQRILNGGGPASSGSATQHPPTTSQQKKSAFQLGAETIKKLGFDPFQQPSSSQQKQSTGGTAVSQDASSRLLARHSAAPGSLPKPRLHTKAKAKQPNVRVPLRVPPPIPQDYEDLSDLGSDLGLDSDDGLDIV